MKKERRRLQLQLQLQERSNPLMAKSKNGCLKILACVGAGSDPSAGSNADANEISVECGVEGRGVSGFRHRVLKNSDISEPETLSSSKAKSEKPLYQDMPGEKILHQEKPIEEPTEKAVEKLDEKPDESISISSSELKQEETASLDGSTANPEEDHVESAAIVIQSGMRTYIARQELSNHKDLVKLQAIIRGHLVRRQAAESLQCLLAIVKMQGDRSMSTYERQASSENCRS